MFSYLFAFAQLLTTHTHTIIRSYGVDASNNVARVVVVTITSCHKSSRNKFPQFRTLKQYKFVGSEVLKRKFGSSLLNGRKVTRAVFRMNSDECGEFVSKNLSR
jgi:hypothetical protein